VGEGANENRGYGGGDDNGDNGRKVGFAGEDGVNPWYVSFCTPLASRFTLRMSQASMLMPHFFTGIVKRKSRLIAWIESRR